MKKPKLPTYTPEGSGYNIQTMRFDKFFHYYAKQVRLIKEIIEDDELTDEEKIRLLGTIL